MSKCPNYDANRIFQHFKLLEFPPSFVGLSTALEQDIELDLGTTGHLKTMCNGKLMKMEDAREESASHRAFDIDIISNKKIKIIFKPTNECISSNRKSMDNRFVFDIRLINVSGNRCCNNELHSEMGRYFVSGKYEQCQLHHSPKVLNYGDILMNTAVSNYVQMRNSSKYVTVKLRYIRITGYEVTPNRITLQPGTTKKIKITIKPACLKVGNTLIFQIINGHDEFNDKLKPIQENCLSYTIKCSMNIIYDKIRKKEVIVKSLHTITEKDAKYTYIGKEVEIQAKRRNKAFELLQISKLSRAQQPGKEKFATGTVKCYDQLSTEIHRDQHFCKIIKPSADTYDLFNIVFEPESVDFGRVGLHTYGETEISIENNTLYDIILNLLLDECILYTKDKFQTFTIRLNSLKKTRLTIFCLGFVEGNYTGTFEYTIDNKYFRRYPYHLAVGNPTLMIPDKILKFGMVTDSFVTSVPVKIFNNFNIVVDFEWDDIGPDTPFEIIPKTGSVPKQSCKICDIIYNCKPSKSKTYDIDIISHGKPSKIIPMELNISTRKLAIKFLQQVVLFKDIPLNLETIEKVRLENSSREIASFYVIEPLIPGLKVEPMCGIIRPKMVMTFQIIVKISCILEFSFDIYIKINNKENIVLPVSGNIVEPKLTIHPKNITVPRVPSKMITFVPITLQNTSSLKAEVEVLDTGDDNIFKVYTLHGNEKERVYQFTIDGNHTKTLFIEVFDIFRREYEMYIPFKVNGLLGPPDQKPQSVELRNYIGDYEKLYENNTKVKLKNINKDISYCKLTGVITVPWVEFSVEKFEIDYVPNGQNTIDFSMTNISKYSFCATVVTAKLTPNFSLTLLTEDFLTLTNETNIKFDFCRGIELKFRLNFHPRSHGRFAATAVLFLDKAMSVAYYNLSFIGTRKTPEMIPSTPRVIFPPSETGKEIKRSLTVKFHGKSEKNSFNCFSKSELCLNIDITECEYLESDNITLISVIIKVFSQVTYARSLTVTFEHTRSEAYCEVEISFYFTYCPITLHAHKFVSSDHNPYPFYPLPSQMYLFEYYENCVKFLEKWMYQQGFHRDLFPVLPESFYIISSTISSPPGGTKTKGINVSFLNFIRRIAGPLMKHVRKITVSGVDEPYKYVKEIHDTYKEIINLLRSRGSDLWILQSKFLLNHDQFIIYVENFCPKRNADILLNNELAADFNTFSRISKQCWFDFILQIYKVFVMDSCFFECVCVSSEPRDIVNILVEWFNKQIQLQHYVLRKQGKSKRIIANLTTDLSDGIAIISAILQYCPFLKEHFSCYVEVEDDEPVGGVIHNACLIIDALTQLKLNFPLSSIDLLKPNYLQMIFLSIHLYVVLPMFKPKDIIKLTPPLLRSSARQLTVSPTSQESLIFNLMLLNNHRNGFTVERVTPVDNSKKIFLCVKYTATFVNEESSILLLYGYNKTRIFDTYIVFLLIGQVSAVNPVRKCKVTGPLYRPNKVDILVSSPFLTTSTFRIHLTDNEPNIPVSFEEISKPRFYLRRLNLMDNEITLNGIPKESGQEVQDHKLYLQIICLTSQLVNSWIWFRSQVGEFFIKVTSQARWDLPIDTIQTRVQSWPMDPCSCGESCECYRTTILLIPQRNDLLLKALRYGLLEYASETMIKVFDDLIETTTGKIVLSMLLEENGTNMSEVRHILRSRTTYKITSRTLVPRTDRVTFSIHSNSYFQLPVTIPARDMSEKYTVTFTSDCGMDIRTYKILLSKMNQSESLSN